MKGNSKFIKSLMLFGYSFLYIPIVILVVFSFNDSPMVTVWAGFTTKWYKALLQNERILSAAWTSLKIATMAATASIVIGTLAAMMITRFKKFKGRSIFSGLIAAPMVVPDVILGLSLLLLFVSLEQLIGWPSKRGAMTVAIAHITLSIAYVVIIIRERLISLDNSLVEAALDLGAKPLTVFFKITLPNIFPSIIAGWLLSFTLSLDDLVLASFTSGAGATTLPMVVFSSIRVGVTPEINALATIIVAIVTIGVIISGIITNKRRA